MDIKDKSLILTGACGGIGSEIARVLADAGAHLILVGRNISKLRALQLSLSEPSTHQALVADLNTQQGLDTIHHSCSQWQADGRAIHGLINIAGSNRFSSLLERKSDSIRDEIHLNLTVPILLSQQALHWMARPGLIVNIGSTFSAIGYPGYTTYCASKAGLHRFSEALDRELDGTGIRVLYLAPRATDTTLNSAIVTELNHHLGNQIDDPRWVANQLLLSLRNETPVRWLGWPEKLWVRVNQILPAAVAGAIRKQSATIRQFLNKAEVL
ncbi:SDR family oxidoreductase [Photobacterium sp. 1_MG-2023]|uniref:SDR family oxidoreductase n=1 Tax=Photobacterium sp. 1_MG-2023 TaxID=3062646 RepID=UPI0026E3E6E3|nr:SDR family oxidoreductase [Photobacterium sp. 1_MG-2023]MDO6705066.1 SDR family oxidoreductase [Photobacterium sp. 1_MG-2023]